MHCACMQQPYKLQKLFVPCALTNQECPTLVHAFTDVCVPLCGCAAWLLSELLEAQRDALALQAVTFAAYAGSLSASAMPEHDTTEAAAGLAAASALADAEGLLAVVKAVLEEHSVLHSRQPF